ncbi:Diaminopimelate decarboxylase [Streptomyces glaucescens]
MGGHPLYLEPRLGSRLGSLLASPDVLHPLVDALGSPLNVVIPEQIAANAERFRAVYTGHHLSGQVYFAHKANRSSALLRRLAATDAGVDVASLGELQHALGAASPPTASRRPVRRTRSSCGWPPARPSPSASTAGRSWTNWPRWYGRSPCLGCPCCCACPASRRRAYGC